LGNDSDFDLAAVRRKPASQFGGVRIILLFRQNHQPATLNLSHVAGLHQHLVKKTNFYPSSDIFGCKVRKSMRDSGARVTVTVGILVTMLWVSAAPATSRTICWASAVAIEESDSKLTSAQQHSFPADKIISDPFQRLCNRAGRLNAP
jgi:hypothetical protein